MDILNVLERGISEGFDTVDECVIHAHIHYSLTKEEFMKLEMQAKKYRISFGNEIPLYSFYVRK